MKGNRQFLKRLSVLLAVCLSISVFYVLNVGPAVLIYRKFELTGHWFGSALEACYGPLEDYARSKSDKVFAELLTGYIDFWAGD